MSFSGKATYAAGGTLPEIADDVADLVSIISPAETPLLDALGDPLYAATSTRHEWLEDELLPARVAGYLPGDLDLMCARGELVWAGVEPLGSADGRVALYLADQEPLLARAVTPVVGVFVVEHALDAFSAGKWLSQGVAVPIRRSFPGIV